MFRVLDRALALDARSLGIARILFGFLLLVDLAYRASDLGTFYTDGGVLPRSLLELSAWNYTWSIHTWSGTAAWVGFLFFIQLVAASCLMIGFRTRIATFVSAVLLGSLHARNPLLRDVQDDLFRVLLFWSLLLPMGRRYSIDRWQMREYGGDTVVSVPSGALMVQVALIDWVGALAKLQSPWWKNGEGVFYALSIGRYQTPLAQVMLESRGLLHFANHAAIALELVVPCLLFVPRLRRVAVLVLIFVHATDALFLELGVYPFLCVAALLALLPREGAEEDPIGSPLLDAVATGAMVLVFLLNVPAVFPRAGVPRPAAKLAATIGLDQSWVLFAPRESSATDGWFVVASESTLEAAYERPSRIAATIEDHRWRQYFANLRLTHPADSPQAKTVEGSREAYLRARCDDTDAARLRLVYLNQKLGAPDSTPKRVDLAELECPVH